MWFIFHSDFGMMAIIRALPGEDECGLREEGGEGCRP
jgi:hypothetical protein